MAKEQRLTEKGEKWGNNRRFDVYTWFEPFSKNDHHGCHLRIYCKEPRTETGNWHIAKGLLAITYMRNYGGSDHDGDTVGGEKC